MRFRIALAAALSNSLKSTTKKGIYVIERRHTPRLPHLVPEADLPIWDVRTIILLNTPLQARPTVIANLSLPHWGINQATEIVQLKAVQVCSRDPFALRELLEPPQPTAVLIDRELMASAELQRLIHVARMQQLKLDINPPRRERKGPFYSGTTRRHHRFEFDIHNLGNTFLLQTVTMLFLLEDQGLICIFSPGYFEHGPACAPGGQRRRDSLVLRGSTTSHGFPCSTITPAFG
ncbi:unnamed protein product [Bursaphelenchus xylophilus]|uniref:(pine wood nematode) hypothetical protein n=1 Tax=Bursaphelenchus xylophilus TaxID=6326 RepID=A0A1I7S9L1_BURXY|nr:unnamed protein product [Bursaphelenchus xylophilus]CAG9131946.1 unnamed protein product [Bursaphelenchus xylophilus]